MTSNHPAGRRAEGLPRPSLALRCAALAAAGLACLVLLGSQLTLVAHYSGEGEAVLARLLPSPAASQVVAATTRSVEVAE
jgi:hypothetical protein